MLPGGWTTAGRGLHASASTTSALPLAFANNQTSCADLYLSSSSAPLWAGLHTARTPSATAGAVSVLSFDAQTSEVMTVTLMSQLERASGPLSRRSAEVALNADSLQCSAIGAVLTNATVASIEMLLFLASPAPSTCTPLPGDTLTQQFVGACGLVVSSTAAQSVRVQPQCGIEFQPAFPVLVSARNCFFIFASQDIAPPRPVSQSYSLLPTSTTPLASSSVAVTLAAQPTVCAPLSSNIPIDDCNLACRASCTGSSARDCTGGCVVASLDGVCLPACAVLPDLSFPLNASCEKCAFECIYGCNGTTSSNCRGPCRTVRARDGACMPWCEPGTLEGPAGVCTQTAGRAVSAVFDMAGVAGMVTFRQATSLDNTLVSATASLAPVLTAAHRWWIAELPFDPAQNGFASCSTVGPMLDPAKLAAAPDYISSCARGQQFCAQGDLSGKGVFNGTMTDQNLFLFGGSAIAGRTLVVERLDGSLRACAFIGFPNARPMTVLRASLQYPLAGTVELIQLAGEGVSETYVRGALAIGAASELISPLRLDWAVTGQAAASDAFSPNIVSRCRSADALFNPSALPFDAAYQLRCGTAAFPSGTQGFQGDCAVGDLTRKLGSLSLDATQVTRFYFVDVNLPLSGPNAVGVRSSSLVFATSPLNASAGPRLACAPLVLVPARTAVVPLTDGDAGGLRGSVVFSQTSPVDTLVVNSTILGTLGRAGAFGLLPQSISGACPSTTAYYAPFATRLGVNTSDGAAAGALSSVMGGLNGTQLGLSTRAVRSQALSLYGPRAFLGQTLSVYGTDSLPLACKAVVLINATSNTVFSSLTFLAPALSLSATFSDAAAAGTVTFARYNASETVVSVQLQTRLRSPLRWFLSSTCGGAVLNPGQLCTTSACLCAAGLQQPHCALGDLTSKMGTLAVGASGRVNAVVVDTTLPLSGPWGVLGATLTLRGADGALACASLSSTLNTTAIPPVTLQASLSLVGVTSLSQEQQSDVSSTLAQALSAFLGQMVSVRIASGECLLFCFFGVCCFGLCCLSVTDLW
jgi:hypothetical protein